jgi:hypothetical protein
MQNTSGSSSQSPDLDWSQVKETITMLCLAVAQIETTLTDGTQSVGKLTDAFISIVDRISDISDCAQRIEDDHHKAEKDYIIETSAFIKSQVQESVIAFQFYDRISQRLDHVTGSINHLRDLIGNPNQIYNPTSWKALQDEIRNSYTMEAERIMFEHIMQGASVTEALEIYHHHFALEKSQKEEDSDDEIELF